MITAVVGGLTFSLRAAWWSLECAWNTLRGRSDV